MLPSLGRRRKFSLHHFAISFFHGQNQSSPPFPSALLLQRLLCDRVATFPDLARAHSVVITSGHSCNPFLAAKLISLYADFQRADLCAGVFSPAIARRPADTFLWNSIAKTHFSRGEYGPALRRYGEMRAHGARPNHFTIPLVASACAELTELGVGSGVHGDSLKAGLLGVGSAAVGSALVYMYSRCEAVGDALKVFTEMPERDVISWTALIVGCAMNGDPRLALSCLRDMHGGGTALNSRTIVAGLQACWSIEALPEGRCLQGLAVKTGSWCRDSARSSALSLYAKCARLDDAGAAFRELQSKDLISWTEILGGYAKIGRVEDCSRIFSAMVAAGVEVDGVAVSCLLSSVPGSGGISVGGALHGFLLRRNLLSGKMAASALLEMYCRLQRPAGAIAVFDVIDEKDEELWALMLSSLAKIESRAADCLEMFRRMLFTVNGVQPGGDCVAPVISSCSRLQELRSGLALHCFCIKNELDSEISVSNSLLGMYGKNQRESYARKIFDRTGKKDVVTWNTFMAGLARAGRSNDALEVFDRMVAEGVAPSSATLVIVLSICAAAAALQRGEAAHEYVRDKGLGGDAAICTALIDMYAKCGQLSPARRIFDATADKDAATWNAMICAHGGHGRAEEALELLEEMVEAGTSPNEITFVAALSACSRAGLVEQGRRVFGRMEEFSVRPSSKHLACMVDLLGRSGRLEEAETMALSAAPAVADAGVWGALLGACRIHGDVEMGERAGRKALELEPCNDGYYVVLSNLYRAAGRKAEAEGLREAMLRHGVRKKAGWSVAELDNVIKNQ